MAITYPTLSQIKQSMQTDLKSVLSGLDFSVENSTINALINAWSGRVDDFYKIVQNQLTPNLFPDTATGVFLERWGSYVNITRNAASRADGFITATGTSGTAIALGTAFQNAAGVTFETQSAASISTVSLSVSSLTQSGGTATCTTTTDHNFAPNLSITISGANEAQYNGTHTILSVDTTKTLTFAIDSSAPATATGTIFASADIANLEVRATEGGQGTNVITGAELTITSPISGVDNAAYVQFDGLTGGADEETDSALSQRIIDRYSNPATPFNEQGIISHVQDNVAGVTRVFVFDPDTTKTPKTVSSITRDGTFATITFSSNHGLANGSRILVSGANEAQYNGEFQVILVSDTEAGYVISGTPSTPATGTITCTVQSVLAGQVKVLFVRDNDDSIIPDAGEVSDVKNAILDIKPAHVSDNDVIVRAPSAKTVNFVFSDLSPDTTAMRTAIQESLDQLFSEQTSVSNDLLEVAYNTAIWQTVDSGGNKLTSFTLSSPTGDVSIAEEEIPVLGTVSF